MLETIDYLREQVSKDTSNFEESSWPYGENKGVFVGKNSLGFTFEAIPVVESSQAIQKELSTLFEEVMEEGESIQCLLWVDHGVSSFLDRWDNARKRSSAVYPMVSRRRSHFFQMPQGEPFRIFRFIFSYSIEGCCDFTLEKLKKKRKKILNVLKSLAYCFCWDSEDFLGVKTPNKTFRVVDYPNEISFLKNQRLIEGIFNSNLQIDVPFYLHYGVHYPKSKWIIPRSEKFFWTQLSVGIESSKENEGEQSLKKLFYLNQLALVEDCYHHPVAALPMSWGEDVQELRKSGLLTSIPSSKCGAFIPLCAGKFIFQSDEGAIEMGGNTRLNPSVRVANGSSAMGRETISI